MNGNKEEMALQLEGMGARAMEASNIFELYLNNRI